MLIPNSRPDRPHAGVLAAAEGSRAPPPQRRRSPSRSIVASPPPSLSASPWKPSSATSRLEPEPITPTAMPSESAQRRTETRPSTSRGCANQSAAPPVRTVVNRASGWPALTPSGGALIASPLDRVIRDQRLAQPEDIAGADRDQHRALAVEIRVVVQAVDQGPLGEVGTGQPPDRPPPRPLGRSLGDLQPADAGQLADRLLARRVDVEDDDLVGGGEGGAELDRQRLGP